MTAFTIQIPDTLYQKLRLAAKQQKATEAELAQTAIQDFLAKSENTPSIIGLFADQTNLIDEVMIDVAESRKSAVLRTKD